MGRLLFGVLFLYFFIFTNTEANTTSSDMLFSTSTVSSETTVDTSSSTDNSTALNTEMTSPTTTPNSITESASTATSSPITTSPDQETTSISSTPMTSAMTNATTTIPDNNSTTTTAVGSTTSTPNETTSSSGESTSESYTTSLSTQSSPTSASISASTENTTTNSSVSTETTISTTKTTETSTSATTLSVTTTTTTTETSTSATTSPVTTTYISTIVSNEGSNSTIVNINGTVTGTSASAMASDNTTNIIIGAVVGSLAAIALVIIVLLLIRHRRSKDKRGQRSPLRDSSDGFTVSDRNTPLQALVQSETSRNEYVYDAPKPPVAAKPAGLKLKLPNTLSVNGTAGGGYSSRLAEEEELEIIRTPSVRDIRNREKVYSQFQNTALMLDAVQIYLVDRLSSTTLISDFKTIPACIADKPCFAARKPENLKKNRFANVLPYDSNRVVLNDDYTERNANDYVNASYIKRYKRPMEYIAAQGPKMATASDFWRLIWQENVSHIVMLTNSVEGKKDKCFEYWPDGSYQMTYGPVTVNTTLVEYRDTFYIRTFSVKRLKSGQARKVTQYQYVTWPDFGVPSTASLVRFWRYVTSRTRANNSAISLAPVLVHCSAGVGRTGTFIGLDIAMQQAVEEGEVDLMQLVKSLREQRCLMVQAAEQFLFLHTALLEAYTARKTVIPVDSFCSVFTEDLEAYKSHSRIDNEFKMLTEMRSLEADLSYDTAKHEANKLKNRNPDILPADQYIVDLVEDVPGRNQYINAVYMPTFHDSEGSIVTQMPLPSTVVDFWRLIYGHRVTAIVSLSSPKEKEFCQYWPLREGQDIQTGPYIITCQTSSEKSPNFTIYSLELYKKDLMVPRVVRLLHYSGWTGEVADEPKHLIDLFHTLTSHTANTSAPYVIQCTEGVVKSGLFCALTDILNRIKYDREVDVYMAVRHVQNVAPTAVSTVAQYRYLYHAVQEKCREMIVYGNIVL